MSSPRVFTIPPSAPFLRTLADVLLDGRLVPGFAPRRDPLALAGATIFLPTRRAARALRHAFLAALDRDQAFLPNIVPLGEADEDALAFAEGEGGLPPAIEPAQRRLVLAKLILKYAEASRLLATTPAAAIALADELARLFDDLTIAGIELEALKSAVLPELDEYWHKSFDFIEIAHKGWTDHLADKRLMDTAMRRDRMLAREAERLKNDAAGPVIAAGSTGTLPAVARLLAVIAQRVDGAVVLPGLDQTLDAESFALVDGGKIGDGIIEPSPGHPQFGLQRLLRALGVARRDVLPLGEPVLPARERLLSEAFRPAATTERWTGADTSPAEAEIIEALSGVTIIEAPDPRAEALAIAVCLRETLEIEGKRAALVTADRALARRVAAELLRWRIEIEDSAGVPLSETEAGRFARLLAQAATEQLAPVALIACLRHPLANFDVSADAVDALEISVLRGPRPAPGRALVQAVGEARGRNYHARDPQSALKPADWDAALLLARAIVARFEPLLALADGKRVSLPRLVAAHMDVLAKCGLNLAQTGREDATELAEAIEHLNSVSEAPELTLEDYAEVFSALISDQPLYPPFDPQARIRILGPLEARLLDFDRIVIGGVNEGTSPPEMHNDSWLNRPMRKGLGLDLPERRVGLSAHDFVQAAAAREVVLTRARRVNGVETVASRFLQRIKAVSPEIIWNQAITRGDHYLALAEALERPAALRRIERPAPRPPLAARPARLSVTEIEALVRDPYTIYARHVLRLLPLDPLDAEPGAAERGTLLHQALADFAKAFPEALPGHALERLLALGREAFAEYKDFPGVRAVWWPRFERVAHWFLAEETARRRELKHIFVERRGEITFAVAGRPFTLSAQADRIEERADRALAIVDYKTGEAPTLLQAINGLAPQLPLEAAIARAGGFTAVAADAPIARLEVIRLSGGTPAGELRSLDPAEASGDAKELADRFHIKNCDALADFARARLKALLAKFADAGMPYHSIPRPKWKSRFGPYDHLARIKEWSESDGGEEG